MGSGLNKAVAAAMKKEGGALERVENLEKGFKAIVEDMTQVMQALQQIATSVDTRNGALEDAVNAIIEVVGRKPIEEEIKRARIEKLEARSAREKVAFDAAIVAGQVVPAEVVGDMSVIIGSEVNKDGDALYPLRVQMIYRSIDEDKKDKFKGVKVGTVIETLMGSKFTISEIWDAIIPSPVAAAEPVTGELVEVPVEQSDISTGDEPVDATTEEALLEDLQPSPQSSN